jgi:hypothetical protein
MDPLLLTRKRSLCKLSSTDKSRVVCSSDPCCMFRRTIEARKSFDGVTERDPGPFLSIQDLHVKDAFLVFRALCKLSMKSLATERSDSAITRCWHPS